MNKFFKISLPIVLLLFVFCLSGCNNDKKKKHEELGTQLATLEESMTSLQTTAAQYHTEGTIDDELYNNINVLATNLKETKALYSGSKGYGNDEKIAKDISDITTKLGEYQKKLTDLMGGSIDNTSTAADELIKKADSLRPFVNDALTKGTITQDTVDEFTQLYQNLLTIKESGDSSVATQAQLREIQDKLAVISSQVGADRVVIDALNDRSFGSTETTTQATTSSQSSNGSSYDYDDDDDNDDDRYYDDDDEDYDSDYDDDEDYDSDDNDSDDEDDDDNNSSSSSDNEDIGQLKSDYENISNEASRRFDLGEISEEEYNKVLNAGNEINDMQESGDTSNAGQVRDELENISENMQQQ